ncbi:MAG: hypothetical protein JRG91_02425 [Deltaproteobacteria bacterium]|nr:hypothetical protein [Deltaproteobacteria bacterium]
MSRSLMCVTSAALLLALHGCGGPAGGADDADGTGDGTLDADPEVPADAADADVPDVVEDGPGACPAATLGAELGRTHLLLGGSMRDEEFALAPFDLRYHYVAGDVPEGGPCEDCASGCTVAGASCAGGGCPWWGCWQWDALPPGRFVADFVSNAHEAGAVPMITYYIWFSVAGDVEGAPEVAALADGSLVERFLADFRFLCQVMNEDPSIPTLIHVEPDLWGYGHQVDSDPASIPAAVSAASAPECSGLADTMEGLARCMLAIARAEAPAVRVGFHASAWGAGNDALVNTDPGFDLAGHAATTAAFMRALGAADADLIVVEMSDRDAGFNDRWWDETNATLPSFTQAISWVSTLGDELGLAPLWWQVPYGHEGLENDCDRYEDNRVDYFFDHPHEFAAGGALGIAFGAGAGCMTTPETDDGHFTGRAEDYHASDRPVLCGP